MRSGRLAEDTGEADAVLILWPVSPSTVPESTPPVLEEAAAALRAGTDKSHAGILA